MKAETNFFLKMMNCFLRFFLIFFPESHSQGKQSLLQYLRDQEFSSENRDIKHLLAANTQTQTHVPLYTCSHKTCLEIKKPSCLKLLKF